MGKVTSFIYDLVKLVLAGVICLALALVAGVFVKLAVTLFLLGWNLW